jgi:hypothetical protein
MNRSRIALAAAAVLAGGLALASAQTVFTTNSCADAFLCTGSPSNPELDGADLSGLNFGAAGTIVIAPASSPSGEFQSVVQFDLSNSIALFNSAYGTNRWLVTGLSLEFRSNYGTAGVQPNNGIFPPVSGGNFVIDWLSDNDWAEGTGTPRQPTTDGVTYNSIAQLLSHPYELLATNTYSPPGDNLPVIYTLPLPPNLASAASAGGKISFLLRAADDQIACLFNSHEFGGNNVPLVHVVAIPLLEITSETITNNSFLIVGIGGTNRPCQIQATTNLAATNWQSIGSATSDGSGIIEFLDSSATNQPARFYRLSQ